ncbi:MAG: RNA-binding protein [Leptospiraceae bacterium]|nr:RNA-binding protein [Leptospiraceae bacterium]MCP5493961.1 RNA-binding protein [Leptospiraceae bacterium]
MNENKIYIGNLPYSVEEDDLENEFSEFGEITEIKLIKDPGTGRSKGFAFVTFATSDAMNASLVKNGKEVSGRNIKVNKAEDKNSRRDNRGGGGGPKHRNRRF